MADKERIFTIVVLVSTLMLTALHFAVAGRGVIWYNDNSLYTTANGANYQQKNFNNYAAYIIIATAGELILCVLLLIDTFKIIFSQTVRSFLLGITLVIEWSLIIIIAILASTSSNEIDAIEATGRSFKDLDSYHGIAVADTVISFILKAIPWVVVFYLSLKKLSGERPQGEPGEPPVTGQRL